MKIQGFSAQKPLYQTWQPDATLVAAREAESSRIRQFARKKVVF